jgi:phosphoglycolate phosphatase
VYKAIIFDLDGTLLNTLDDLAASCNHALLACGYPARTVEEVRAFVGNGIRKLMERALPPASADEAVDRALDVFRAHYALHNSDRTQPYPGILPMLEALKQRGLPICVLSNKNDPNVQALCQRYFPGLITLAAGEKPGLRPKPHPDGVLWLCSQLGLSPADVCLVGDSEVDVATARAAGVPLLAVDWGFRSQEQLRAAGAETVAHSAEELTVFFSFESKEKNQKKTS